MYALPPTRTGKRGRPREKGDRLGSLAALASATAFRQVTVTRYGKTAAISAAAVTCLWPSVFGTRPVTVVLIRDKPGTGYDLALVTTDLDAGPAAAIERYAARWSIEVAIQDARQVFGAGQARNRTARAVERTVPSQLACQARLRAPALLPSSPGCPSQHQPGRSRDHLHPGSPTPIRAARDHHTGHHHHGHVALTASPRADLAGPAAEPGPVGLASGMSAARAGSVRWRPRRRPYGHHRT